MHLNKLYCFNSANLCLLAGLRLSLVVVFYPRDAAGWPKKNAAQVEYQNTIYNIKYQ